MTDGQRTRQPGYATRILIADPDDTFATSLRDFLTPLGYQVTRVSSYEAAVSALKMSPPDLLILEVDIADQDGQNGHSLIANAPAPRIHIMILSNSGRDADVIAGLDMGADSYVVKPVTPAVVAARIRALLRQPLVHGSTAPSPVLSFGNLVIDTRNHDVQVDGSHVDLSDKEFSLLAFLASSPQAAFTRDQILGRVWSDSRPHPSTATVTEHISRVRSKIEPDPEHPRWILTIPGEGYKFERRAQPR